MILLLLLFGLIAGIMAGFFGVGGGILFTPIFFMIFNAQGVENPVAWTIGTSLFCTFTAALSSSIQHFRQKNIYLSQGLSVGVLGMIGVYLGKKVVESAFYTDQVFIIFFALLLVLVSFLFYRRGSKKGKVDNNLENIGLGKAGITGGFGGFVAALAGVGGGIVMVPIMNLWYKIELNRAVSISAMAIVIIAFSGWVQFAFFADGGEALSPYSLGTVDFGTALPVIIGAFVGGMIGARLNQKVSDRAVQFGFSALIIVVAGVMIYNLF